MNNYRYSIIYGSKVTKESDFAASSDRAAKLYVTELGTVRPGVPAVHNWGSKWYTIPKTRGTRFEKTCPTEKECRIVLMRYIFFERRNLPELSTFTHG